MNGKVSFGRLNFGNSERLKAQTSFSIPKLSLNDGIITFVNGKKDFFLWHLH